MHSKDDSYDYQEMNLTEQFNNEEPGIKPKTLPAQNCLAQTFDTIASSYEKMRPGYPDKLYQTIFHYMPLGKSSNAVEVGIGGGQATLPVLQTGCRLTAVEYGEHFSSLCRKKFSTYPEFSVITAKFEDINFNPGTYDFVFSASAFHWIPEETGYKKVFSMLKSGGAFARFANHPFAAKENPRLCKEIQNLYAIYMNSTSAPVEYTKENAEQRADIAYKYGFCDIQYKLFQRTRTFTAKEYTALLGTYSDHISLEENKRTEFFSEIEKTIDHFGGKITIYDTIDLQLARKP